MQNAKDFITDADIMKFSRAVFLLLMQVNAHVNDQHPIIRIFDALINLIVSKRFMHYALTE